MSKKSELNIDSNRPTVFISYSWDSEEHKSWVLALADSLEEYDIQVIIDKRDFHLGDFLPLMMEEAISKSDYVLFVCTENYKYKSDNRKGGVIYEDAIITGELYLKQNNRKYIPIFRSNRFNDVTPNWAIGKMGVCFLNVEKYQDNIRELVKEINPRRLDIIKPDFYHLTKDMQKILLNNLESLLDQCFYHLSELENIIMVLESIDPNKLDKEIQSLLKETIDHLNKLGDDEFNSIMMEQGD